MNITINRQSINKIWFRALFLLVFSFPFLANAASGVFNTRRTMQYTSRSLKDAAIWQSEVRRNLFELLKMEDLLAGRDNIELNPEEVNSENKGEYFLKEIEFNSTKDRRIRVILTVPANTVKLCPAVVSIHGHGGKSHSVYDKASIYKGFASELAERNFVTIAPIVSQHEVYKNGRTLMGERLWDLMRCVDYLESLKVVDKNRIGCAGLSLGGEMAMWLGAMDERIQATLSSGFLTKMDQMEENHCMCWKFPGLRELVDFADIYSLIAPRALQCQNGLKEPPDAFTVTLAREALKEIKLIYTDYHHPQNLSFIAHGGAHEIDLPSLLAFFEETLGVSSLRKMEYASRSVEDAKIWQHEVRNKLLRLLRLDELLASRNEITLNPKEILSEDKGSYMLKEIEINSTPGRRIRVVVTYPRQAGKKYPAVVCIHGHKGKIHSVYDSNSIYKGFASELAACGYVTIAGFVSQHNVYEDGMLLMGERLWDLMRCIDYLETLDLVDKHRIGCAGLSLGGEMAMWLGAMDLRIKKTVSSGFLSTMDQLENHICYSYLYFQGFPEIRKPDRCWKFMGLRELVDFADIYSLIAPRELQCQNGLKEPPNAFPVPLARETLKEIEVIYSDFECPENLTLVAHEEGHVIDLPSLLAFFDKGWINE